MFIDLGIKKMIKEGGNSILFHKKTYPSPLHRNTIYRIYVEEKR